MKNLLVSTFLVCSLSIIACDDDKSEKKQVQADAIASDAAIVDAVVGGVASDASVGGSVVDASVGGSVADASIGGSVADASVAGAVADASVGGSVADASIVDASQK